MSEHRIETDTLQLAAQGFGDPRAPAIVLVMGATASRDWWPLALCEALANGGFQVVRYDHRDTGASTTVGPGAARYAAEDLATDLVALLDGLGLATAHLVGMSLGGLLAQMVALDHPARVRSLTLIGSEPLGWTGAVLPGMATAFLDHFAGFAGLDWSDRSAVVEFRLGISRLCAGALHPFDETATRMMLAAEYDRARSPESAFNHGSVGLSRDWSGRLETLTPPTLVIHGTEDPILPLPNGEALAGTIRGARLVVLEGAGHDLPAPLLPRIATEILTHARAAESTPPPSLR